MQKLILLLFIILLQGYLIAQNRSNKVTLQVDKFEGLPEGISINNVVVDDNGVVWAATDQGLYLINPSLGTSEKRLDKNNVIDLAITPFGQWVAYDNTLFCLDDNKEITLDKTNKINDIAIVDRTIWAATTNGIFQINPSTLRTKRYGPNNSDLKSDKINFIHQDRHKIIWVGTDNGYIRIDEDDWESQDEKYQMLLTHENHEGQWIISDDDLFLMNEFNRYFPVGIEEGLIEGPVRDFTIDSKGKLYIVSDKLVRYDPYENDIDNFIENVQNITSACTSVEKDRNDNIWIGTESNGLFMIRFSDNKSSALYSNLVLTNEIRCHGDQNASLEAVVVGGTPPYSFEWNTGDAGTAKLENISEGSYDVTVTDSGGNKFKSSKKVHQPPRIEITNMEVSNVDDLRKPNGSISVTAQGGSGNLSYQWSNGLTGRFIQGLSAGNYTLTILDSKGCKIEETYIIEPPKYIPALAVGKLQVGTTLRIEQLFFEADSTSLQPDNYPILNEIHNFLIDNPNVKIEIGGHTNNIPPHDYCDKLSEERAKTVAFYLYDLGIQEDRISYVGYGKRKPLDNANTAVARKRNQRVEMKIISL